jgi:hypothetical protein
VRKVNELSIVSEIKHWEVKAKLVLYLAHILLSKVFLFLQVRCGCDPKCICMYVYVCVCVYFFSGE